MISPHDVALSLQQIFGNYQLALVNALEVYSTEIHYTVNQGYYPYLLLIRDGNVSNKPMPESRVISSPGPSENANAPLSPQFVAVNAPSSPQFGTENQILSTADTYQNVKYEDQDVN